MSRTMRLVLIALAVAVLEIAFLGTQILGRASILRDGREVVLEVRPVDPRDLLRGDYVRLSYNISRLSKAVFGTDRAEVVEGSPVYVRLRADDKGIWQAVAASFGEPIATAPAPDEVDIRGKMDLPWAGTFEDLPVDYGIERFYVPEGEGRAIESDMRERSFTMKVAVSDTGTAQIKAFMDGDTLVYQEPIY